MNPFANIGRELIERPGHACTESMRFKGGIRHSQKDGNLWKLTECEERTLAAIVEGGSSKGAAQILGLSNKTVENHSRQARLKIGVNTTIHAVLEWDRAKRQSI